MTTLALTVVFVTVGVTAGLQVSPVRLARNATYVSFYKRPSQSNGLLECPYHLGHGEYLAKVTWVLWKENRTKNSTFEWTPSGRGQASGLLRRTVRKDRSDGNLEMSWIRRELGGFYLCSVTLTDGTVVTADRWEEVLVIDKSNRFIRHTGSEVGDCVYKYSYRPFPVIPEPTVRSGLWSEELGDYYYEVVDWQKSIIEHSGAMRYFYRDHLFKIDEHTPHDVSLVSAIGVYKSDGTYIHLSRTVINSYYWTDRGCPILESEEHSVVYSRDPSVTCRKERKFDDSSDNTAWVSCNVPGGYDTASDLITIRLVCNMTTYKWMAPDDSLDDLVCVTTASYNKFHDHGDHNGTCDYYGEDYGLGDGDSGFTLAPSITTTLLAPILLLLLCLLQPLLQQL